MKFIPVFVMGDLVTYGAVSPPYTFCITHDKTLNIYGASWRDREGSESNFIGDDIHPEVGLPHFKTIEEAVQACKEQLKKLVN